jgi:hypothetical protein
VESLNLKRSERGGTSGGTGITVEVPGAEARAAGGGPSRPADAVGGVANWTEGGADAGTRIAGAASGIAGLDGNVTAPDRGAGASGTASGVGDGEAWTRAVDPVGAAKPGGLGFNVTIAAGSSTVTAHPG